MAKVIQIGDKVKFLDEVGGGTVIKILDNKMALVQTPDGFEIPYLINKLIVTGESAKQNNQPEPLKKSDEQSHKGLLDDYWAFQEPDIIKDNEEINIYLALVPKNPFQLKDSQFEVHIVNDSNWHLLYLYQLPEQEKKYKSFPSHLQPNLMELLFETTSEKLQQQNEIIFQILFFRRTPHQYRKPLIVKIKFKSEKILNPQAYLENDYFDSPALLYPLIEEHPLEKAIEQLQKHDFHKIKYEKEDKNKKINKPRLFHSGKKPDTWEIDLHITELLDDTRGMSAKDMLDYQMQVFKDKLDQAFKDPNVKKVIFIHGKGNGRLRHEIRSFLDRKKIPYQDASFAKYGFGATLVFIKHSPKSK